MLADHYAPGTKLVAIAGDSIGDTFHAMPGTYIWWAGGVVSGIEMINRPQCNGLKVQHISEPSPFDATHNAYPVDWMVPIEDPDELDETTYVYKPFEVPA